MPGPSIILRQRCHSNLRDAISAIHSKAADLCGVDNPREELNGWYLLRLEMQLANPHYPKNSPEIFVTAGRNHASSDGIRPLLYLYKLLLQKEKVALAEWKVVPVDCPKPVGAQARFLYLKGYHQELLV
jgi:hypothetical protein